MQTKETAMNQYTHPSGTIVAEALGVSKSYDDVKAIDDVSVQINIRLI